MTTRRYPTEGRKDFLKVLDSQDYVEVEEFEGPFIGYFCSTCIHFVPVELESDEDERITEGTCKLLDNAPVRSFGCCNAWTITDEEPLLQSDGTEDEDTDE